MKIRIVSDAWRPQINGIVRTLEMTAEELARMDCQTLIIGPDVRRRATISVPFYREIKLEFFARRAEQFARKRSQHPQTRQYPTSKIVRNRLKKKAFGILHG